VFNDVRTDYVVKLVVGKREFLALIVVYRLGKLGRRGITALRQRRADVFEFSFQKNV
jgi:hypothetical protein